MSSQVFYRKWRPQSLSQVAGQEPVTKTLLNALTSGRVSHAYLFAGPRGTGKTSTGRIIAKAVNCLKNDGRGEPCNSCATCAAITGGRALDVIEIDAASNRRIDEIRELRERVGYAPAQARFKVYIIDEVHMLTTEAANALLKTLEEPPPYVIFILATTEVHKLLPTIISRCQRFDFHRLKQGDIASRLDAICKAEGIKIESEGISLIARSAQGSLRDAENILEQLTTYYGRSLTLSQVQEALGITTDVRVKELLRQVLDAEVAAGIGTINSVANDGIDLKQFSRELVRYLRGLLLAKTEGTELPDFSAEDAFELKSLSAKASLVQILDWLKVFGGLEASADSYSTLPLEIAFLEATVGVAQATISPKSVEVAPVRMEAPTAKAAPPVTGVKTTANRIIFGARREETPPVKGAATSPPAQIKKAPLSPSPEPPPSLETPQSASMPLTAGDELEKLKAGWRQITVQAPLELIRTNAAAILRSAGVSPVAINGDTVVLAFKHQIFKEKMSESENLRVAEKILSRFLGRSCQVRCTYEPEANHLVQEAQKMGGQITSVEEK